MDKSLRGALLNKIQKKSIWRQWSFTVYTVRVASSEVHINRYSFTHAYAHIQISYFSHDTFKLYENLKYVIKYQFFSCWKVVLVIFVGNVINYRENYNAIIYCSIVIPSSHVVLVHAATSKRAAYLLYIYHPPPVNVCERIVHNRYTAYVNTPKVYLHKQVFFEIPMLNRYTLYAIIYWYDYMRHE